MRVLKVDDPGIRVLSGLGFSLKSSSPSPILAKALADLDAAQQTQEINVATLPGETLGIYETKGRLLGEIEEINRVAKIAFWDRKDLSGQFNALLYCAMRSASTWTTTLSSGRIKTPRRQSHGSCGSRQTVTS